MSSGSTSESSCLNTLGIRGFPTKCLCGCDSTIYTSETQKNPGRPFFICVSGKKNHLFKWLEEVVQEEVEDALPKIVGLEAALYKAKFDVESLKEMMNGLTAEVVRAKTELKRCNAMFRIGFGVICLINLVVVVSLLLKTLF